MQIQTIRKGFKSFESKFKLLKRNSKHLNANSNQSKGIQSIRMQVLTIQKGFEAFDYKFQTIRMQIWTIWKGFEAFECKFEPFERNLKHSNANANHSNQIRTIWTGVEAFEC